MGRKAFHSPKLRRQAGSTRPNGSRRPDRAFVEIDGKRLYLGEWDTAEATSAYHRLLAERHAGIREVESAERDSDASDDLTIVELVDAFQEWLEERHRQGRLADPKRFNPAVAPLVDLYGTTRVRDFRPKHLLAIQQAYIEKGWHTRTINERFGLVKRPFRWGISRGYTTPEQVYGLSQVEAVEPSFEDAPRDVKPAPLDDVEAVKRLTSRQVRAMIDLQLLTGARPGEVCIMRPKDLEMGREPWEYRPSRHKNLRRGHDRVIYLGPQAQEVIRPFLAGRRIDAYLFSPAEADEERRAKLHAMRRTPLSCGNRPGWKRTEHPQRVPGERYRTSSYARAIRRACRLAGLPEWSPNQLRHTFATRVRAEAGLDIASTLLGHSKVETTQIYAEQNHARAREVIRQSG